MPIAASPPVAGRLDATVFKVTAVVVGVIVSILDVTVVTVALPTFQTVFGAGYATVAWTMILVLATVMPAVLLARQRPAALTGADPGARVLVH